MNHVQSTEKKPTKKTLAASVPDDVSEGLRERVDQVRDIVENVRDKAEVAFRDKPYLVPVAAGAVGFGVGLLFGSKITRYVVLTAVGALMTEAIGGEVKRLAGDFVGELQNRLAADDGGESDSADEGVKAKA